MILIILKEQFKIQGRLKSSKPHWTKSSLKIQLGPVKQKFQRKIAIIFLSISLNICFG